MPHGKHRCRGMPAEGLVVTNKSEQEVRVSTPVGGEVRCQVRVLQIGKCRENISDLPLRIDHLIFKVRVRVRVSVKDGVWPCGRSLRGVKPCRQCCPRVWRSSAEALD